MSGVVSSMAGESWRQRVDRGYQALCVEPYLDSVLELEVLLAKVLVDLGHARNLREAPLLLIDVTRHGLDLTQGLGEVLRVGMLARRVAHQVGEQHDVAWNALHRLNEEGLERQAMRLLRVVELLHVCAMCTCA